MRPLMVQGTSSGAGKTVLAAAFCRIFSDMGLSVAPFKSQNMSRYSYIQDGFEISRAQAVQAVAARCPAAPDMNPILLKPLGDYTSEVFLGGKRYKKMSASEYYRFAKPEGLKIAMDAFGRLRDSHDIIIMEGAGSPAEINLERYDIANMTVAEKAKAAVLLVSDIERGGSFAGMMGTMVLLRKKHQKLVRGFVINKFRGDAGILKPGLAKFAILAERPVLGVIPMMDLGIPEEDSLGSRAAGFAWDDAGLKHLNAEIDRLARTVKENLNMRKIVEMVK